MVCLSRPYVRKSPGPGLHPSKCPPVAGAPAVIGLGESGLVSTRRLRSRGERRLDGLPDRAPGPATIPSRRIRPGGRASSISGDRSRESPNQVRGTRSSRRAFMVDDGSSRSQRSPPDVPASSCDAVLRKFAVAGPPENTSEGTKPRTNGGISGRRACSADLAVSTALSGGETLTIRRVAMGITATSQVPRRKPARSRDGRRR